MKLFIVAALVSVAAAARLEHLERGYLPPDHSHGQASFGSQGQGFGFQGSQGFESNVIDSAATRSQGNAFPGATSNQYLPPDHGPSGSGQFSGSLTGFRGSQSHGAQSHGAQSHGAQSFGAQSHGSQSFGSQYTPNQFGSASNGFGQARYQQQYQSQFPAASRQYLAPKSSFQNIPQQAFDEQTGYHY